MDKTSKNKAIKDYVYGFLLFMLSFLVVITLLSVILSLVSGVPSNDVINAIIPNFLPIMGFSVIIWLPLALICGHLSMKHGLKKALKFTVLANLGVIAAVVLIRGACGSLY